MNIIGLSAFYHDSSCCLLQDGKLIAAASEERFTRKKHDSRLPTNAFRYCLDEAGLNPSDLDCIAYYESPIKKSARQLASFPALRQAVGYPVSNPNNPIRLIREYLGFDGEINCFDHHLSHAASAYFYSGFPQSAIMTIDGVGEWATTGYGRGEGNSIELFETVDFPHSLGLLYATITAFLGFRVNNGEFKVMGLAAYGKPKYLDKLHEMIIIRKRGQFRLNMDFFDFQYGNSMYSPKLPELLGMEPRQPESAICTEHENLACSIQALLENILLEKLNYLHQVTGMENLAMAGGVALNAVANRRIRKEASFRKFFFQPVAGDAGGALGAAALAYQKLGGQVPVKKLSTLYLGPQFSNSELFAILSATGIKFEDYRNQEDLLIEKVTERLMANQIIGWFQGRMEFGPRALGARSILANPMGVDIKERINTSIKKRETFRPFAPIVLQVYQNQHFDLDLPIPFMNEISLVESPLDLPAITHVDGTARPQSLKSEDNPRLAKLLQAFYQRTGCPMLVNTSFNQRGEPIVCTPVDALICMGDSALDALVVGDLLIKREDIPKNWPELLAAWGYSPTNQGTDPSTGIKNLYSFT